MASPAGSGPSPQFSRADAERLPAYDAALERAAALLRELVLSRPPNAGGGISS